MMVMGAPAWATHVDPAPIEGNASCGELGDGAFDFEIKVEPVVDGTYGPVTIDVRDTADGQVFDWSSSIAVDAVFAKGGAVGGNLYEYSPPALSDTGLHAPENPSENWAGLSHISFCWNEGFETTTTTTNPPTTPGPTQGTTPATVGATTASVPFDAVPVEVLGIQVTAANPAEVIAAQVELPFTGISTAGMMLAGSSALLSGLVFVVLGRRRGEVVAPLRGWSSRI
jgi:hypothetical protein